MTFDKFKQYPQQISTAFKRFPITIGFLTFLTLLIIGCTITAEKNPFFFEHNHRFIFWIYAFVGLSITTSVLLEFVQERYRRIRPAIQFIPYGIIGLITYLCAFTLKHGPLYLSAIGIAFLMSVLLVPSIKEKNDIFLWNFIGRTIKALFTAIIITGLFLAGLAIIIFSCEALFRLNLEWIFFKYVMQVCWGFIAPVIMLAGMPNLKELEEEKPLNKFISGSLHFLFVPVLLIYLVILYIFAIRNATALPIEPLIVTTFIAIATAVGIVISLLLYPAGRTEKNSFDKYFLKFLPVALTPLLIPMSIDVVENLRTPYVEEIDIYLVLLNLWFFGAMAILFLNRIQKKIWWILASLCLTNLVFTCSPYNIEWMTQRLAVANQITFESYKDFSIDEENTSKRPSYTEYSFYCQNPKQVPIPKNRSSFIQLSYHNVNDSLFNLSNDTLVFSIALNDSLKENFSIALSQIIVPDSVDSDTLPPLELDNPDATLLLTRLNATISNDTTGTNNMSVKGYLFLK